MENLFSAGKERLAPFAERLRPKSLDDYIGQDHLVGKNGILRKMIENDQLSSFVLWGPPGTGKTSLASVIANATNSYFVRFSAVEHGVADLRKIITFAEERLELNARRTIVFVDEIHRLNKGQQDAFLPHTEKGTFIMIGATTENPSFSINSALLSRAQVFPLYALSSEDLQKLLERAKQKLSREITPEAESLIIQYADGDARKLLTLYETLSRLNPEKIDQDLVRNTVKSQTLLYDRQGEEHYNVISAFIKSMRGSDDNAAIYYLARMLAAGEDPRFIARRMLIFASEDVGLADPQALPLAMSAYHAAEKLGMPEIRIPLGHVVTYLARAAKNNTSYLAIDAALEEIKQSGALPVPLHLRNAPTKLMKEMGYGKGYEYAHSLENKKPTHGHLPEKIMDKKFFK